MRVSFAYGGYSASSSVDVTPPALVSAAISASGLTLTLTYDEALDTGSTPATSAYSIAGISPTITGVTVVGSTVAIALSGAVTSDIGGVTISYTPPGSGKVRDLVANNATSLSSQAVTNGSTVSLVPPLDNYAFWFDADLPGTFAYNPNFRYASFTNQGLLTGTWAASGYNNRLRRESATFNSGASTRWAAWNDGTTGRNLAFGGTASQMRFLHDGTGHTLFFVVRSSSTSVRRFMHTCTASTARGCLYTGQNGQQRFSAQIGNGSAQAANLQTTLSSLPTDDISIVTVRVNPYTTVGDLCFQIRIRTRSGTSTTYTSNWLAVPGAGVDASTTAKLFDTLIGLGFSLLAYKDADRTIAFNSSDHNTLENWLYSRFILGSSLDAFAALSKVVCVGEGDSNTAGVNGEDPWIQRITLKSPFDYTNIGTAGEQIGPTGSSGGNNMLDEAASQVDSKYDGTKLGNIFILGPTSGTNDMYANRTGLQIWTDTKAWHDARHAAHPTVKTFGCTVPPRAGLTVGKQAELDDLNNRLIADHSFMDGFFDLRSTVEDWTTKPTCWQPDQLHLATPGSQVVADGMAPGVNALY